MSKDWTPETLKEYTDVQSRMVQEEMDRRFRSSESAFTARADRVDQLFDLVNLHLARLDEAMNQVQGGQRTSNRLISWVLGGIGTIAGIVALIVYSIPHK